MSSEKLTTVKDSSFGKRFAEACGTDKPAEIERKYGLSYHTAKNYLEGRLPSPEMLKEIRALTNVQIDWLLTGEGERFARPSEPPGLLEVLDARIREIVRNELSIGPMEKADMIFAPSLGKINVEEEREEKRRKTS